MYEEVLARVFNIGVRDVYDLFGRKIITEVLESFDDDEKATLPNILCAAEDRIKGKLMEEFDDEEYISDELRLYYNGMDNGVDGKSDTEAEEAIYARANEIWAERISGWSP